MTTLYCRVVDGAVVEGPRQLPAVLGNISNFPALPDVLKADFGWLPVTENHPDYDPRIETISEPTYTINADQVIVDYTVSDRPLADIKTDLIALGKERTRTNILAAAPEYQQRNAALGLLEASEKEAVLATIQYHRDACDATKIAILAAGTAAEAVTAYSA